MPNITLLNVAHKVRTEIPDVPLPHITQLLRETLVDFCENSESYTYRIDPITLIEGINEYEVDTPRGTVVSKVLRLSYERTRLEPSSEILLEEEVPGWEERRSRPTHFFYARSTLTFAPVPPQTQPLAVRGTVALKPSFDSSEIDLGFLDENYEGVKHGVLSRLYGEANQPWSNASREQKHFALFQMQIENARAKARQDHTAKKGTVAYGGF